jgi:type IV secretion system protein TrbL
MHALKARFRLLLLLLITPVMAQATTVGLSPVIKTFQSVTQGWYHAIFTDALGLFAALFGIEVTWLAVTWMIGGKDVHDIFSSFVKKLLSIGFFFTVLEYSGQWVPWIINGFKNVAVTAGGEPVTTVGFIAMTGVRAFVLCVEAGPMAMAHDSASFWTDVWNLNLGGAASSLEQFGSADIGTVSGIGLLVGAIVGLILILSFTYVVLELVAVQLEGMAVLSWGVIMLGFGGSSFTSRFVEPYMQYSVSVGVRLMVITLWASFIEWQVNPLIKTTLINGNASLEAYGIVLILALLIAWLTKKLPGFANSILSGQSTLSGSEIYGAVKAGTIAAAAVVTGGAALAAGAAGAAGAGAMGAAEGAAGSSGVGSLGASQAAGAGSSEAGALQAPALPQGTETGSGVQAPVSGQPSASSGTQAPDASGQAPSSGAQATPSGSAPASGGQGTASGTQAPDASGQAPSSGAQATPSGSAPASGGQAAPSGSAPASGGQGTASGTQAPDAPGQTPSDPVDHRPAAPNESPSGGSSNTAGVQAPGTGSGKGGDGSGKGNPEQKPPTPFDLAKDAFTQTKAALHGAHDTLTPGSPSNTGVQAPSLGVKHLSD